MLLRNSMIHQKSNTCDNNALVMTGLDDQNRPKQFEIQNLIAHVTHSITKSVTGPVQHSYRCLCTCVVVRLGSTLVPCRPY